MDKDDVIRMAREAGFADMQGTVHAAYQLEQFAALVAAAEREACAECADGYDSMIAGLIRSRGRE